MARKYVHLPPHTNVLKNKKTVFLLLGLALCTLVACNSEDAPGPLVNTGCGCVENNSNTLNMGMEFLNEDLIVMYESGLFNHRAGTLHYAYSVPRDSVFIDSDSNPLLYIWEDSRSLKNMQL